jgi:hypothetical protein
MKVGEPSPRWNRMGPVCGGGWFRSRTSSALMGQASTASVVAERGRLLVVIDREVTDWDR